MSEVKRYAERDIMQLDRDGNHYCNHVLAMTAEGLHSKSDIAAELAFRDSQFDRVTAERDAALGQLKEKREEFNKLGDRDDALQQRLTAADERLDAARAFVTRLIERAGDQPSIATGYLNDILDALKPAETASDEHVCTGCGSKGWTANCKECVPY
ncbi:MAG: hypothetical protein Q7T99_16505 [Pseudomonas sp.]|nr:hypothetical protein [Pseudomonas sp.]